MSNLTGIVRLLKKEQDRLTKELRGIGAALASTQENCRCAKGAMGTSEGREEDGLILAFSGMEKPDTSRYFSPHFLTSD